MVGDVVKARGTLANTILHGKVEGEKIMRKASKMWLDDVKEWTGLILNEGARGPSGLEKEGQSCCPQRIE